MTDDKWDPYTTLRDDQKAILNRMGPERSEPNGRTPTVEELLTIRDFVLLPLLLTYVENGRKSAARIDHPMKELFMMAIDALMDRIHADLVQVRKALKAANIKVWEDAHLDSTMWYKYLYRGYEDRFAITRDLVKAEMSVRLGKYFARVFKNENVVK